MSRPERKNTRRFWSFSTKKVLDTRTKLAKEAEQIMKAKAAAGQGGSGGAQAENIIEEDPDIIF